jgi:predicted ATP-binding protein involved in virulence
MPPPTRLEKLELENFRCFSRLDVEFHEKLTVIVAPNGGGKTALLDAACFGWHYFVQGTDFEEISKSLRNEDVRQVPKPDGTMIPMKPVRLHGTTLVGGEQTEWTVEKGGKTAKNTSTQGADPMREVGRRLRQALQDNAEGKLAESVTLPTIGYYGTGRLWAPQKVTAARRRQIKADTSPISGYDQCLSPSSRFALFEVWFARYSLAALVEKYDGKASLHRSGDKLAGVKAALDSLLKPATGWHSFYFHPKNETILAQHDAHGELPVSKLSDGLRIMIGLAGDIAHRCVRLNPHLGATAPQLTPGVIMIDEVDMHLHPEWQQLVLQALQDAFPLIQFIVTTHSPQVLTTVKRENIRILTQHPDGLWSASVPRPACLDNYDLKALLELSTKL